MAVKKSGAGRAKRASGSGARSRDRAKPATSKGGRRTGLTRTTQTGPDGRGPVARSSAKKAKPAKRAAKKGTSRTTTSRGQEVSGSLRSSAKSASPSKAAKSASRTKVAKSASRTKAAKSASRTKAAKSASRGSAEPKVKKALGRYRAKRDFEKTAEPSGDTPVRKAKALRFVIQKHAASHLHFDWRLELDGVMKSWAVPKGPSVVPGERRLAMEVEDHPISYNTFEGTIPKGQYGGGTVMLWDRGVYEATDGGGAESLRRGYAKGKLDITLLGERLKGSFTMVRTRGDGERAQWLLMKRTDDWSDEDRDIVTEITTSVDSGRTMEQIAAGKRIWNSNRK